MTSEVEICNVALSYIGQNLITSLTAASNEAQQCNLHYALERDVLMESHDWHFGIGRVPLVAVTNDREDEWRYAYQRPSVAKTPLAVFDAERNPGEPQNRFRLENHTIYSNMEDAQLIYAGISENPGDWPATFRMALSCCIAKAVVMSLTEDLERFDRRARMAENAVSSAQCYDTRQRAESQTYQRPPEALIVRFGLHSPSFTPFERAVIQ